jgi:hypothetical protein
MVSFVCFLIACPLGRAEALFSRICFCGDTRDETWIGRGKMVTGGQMRDDSTICVVVVASPSYTGNTLYLFAEVNTTGVRTVVFVYDD